MISYYTYLPSKTIMAESFKTMQYTHCLSFNVTVSSFCTCQAFAYNVIGLRMVLSGAAYLGHVVPSLVCNRVAPGPIPDMSVSRYRGFVSS